MKGNDCEIVNIPVWERIYFGNVCFPVGSKELDGIVRAYIPNREASLMKLYELKEKIGPEGLDLLWLLLDLNPATRISAETALQHCFFDSIK